MIQVKDLDAYYSMDHEHLSVLDHITFDLEKGEIGAILGPSGCGKSTLLKILAGIHSFYSGTVHINNRPPDPAFQRIGYIPQQHVLLPWKTVYENVEILKKIKDKQKKCSSQNTLELLRQLDLETLKDRYPAQLSGGQQQRIAIARAFLLYPDLLLMDEPFSALDALTREEIQEIFLRIWKENQITTVLVTHSIEEALYLGKKIIILSSMPGEILQIIENPLFGTKHKDAAFYDAVMELRSIMKRG